MAQVIQTANSTNDSYCLNCSQVEYYASLKYKFELYFAILVVPAGCASNIVTFLIYHRSPRLNYRNKLSHDAPKQNVHSLHSLQSFFNRCLAISNLAVLLFFLFVTQSGKIFNYDLYIKSNMSCKIVMWFRRILWQMSPTIETLLTVTVLIV